MTFLEQICTALRDADVRYAVVGGYAVALHGAVRGTVDIDLAFPWTERTLVLAEAALNGIGLVSALPVSARVPVCLGAPHRQRPVLLRRGGTIELPLGG